jgi:SAM-dependent methyltransferase
MKTLKQCGLCSGKLEQFLLFRDIQYHRCLNCNAVLMDSGYYPSSAAEKERYDQHNNDPADPGYRRFVTPLVNKIKELFNPDASGLDYGAGSGPVVAAMLKEAGYKVALYDPFYWTDPQALSSSYDFIVCCEVIEHFHSPLAEFKKLGALLNPGGAIFCMTELFSLAVDFVNWHYKNDPTHVFFYHRDSLQWIKNHLGFKTLSIDGRLIILTR